MALILAGRNESSFKGSDGNQVTGITLHLLEDIPDPVNGTHVERFYIHEKKPGYETAKTIPFGSVITPVYNRYGKVEDIIWKTPDKPFSLKL